MFQDLVVTDRLPNQDASILPPAALTRIPSENKRCHELPAKSLQNPCLERSRALFKAFRAVSKGDWVSVKFIYSIYAPASWILRPIAGPLASSR